MMYGETIYGRHTCHNTDCSEVLNLILKSSEREKKKKKKKEKKKETQKLDTDYISKFRLLNDSEFIDPHCSWCCVKTSTRTPSYYISGPLGSLSSFRVILIIEFHLSGVRRRAHVISGQWNQVCNFHFFGVFFAFKGSNYSELIKPHQWPW